MEFRPGDVLYVMSALVTHGNIPIREHESRQSWTMYTAGGLFRWLVAGRRTVKSLKRGVEQSAYARAAQAFEEESWGRVPTLASLTARLKL